LFVYIFIAKLLKLLENKRYNNEASDMDNRTLLKTKRDMILEAAKRHGARNVRSFGSTARGEDDSQSDIDFLVDLEPGRSILDHASLLLELQQLLGPKVDVVSERGIKNRIRGRILREAIPL
jgi:predicted nucleotidyltransferase